MAQRAEETSSPNVLEQYLKSIKCFRLAAKQPIEDVYMADATLVGCKKKMEAKPRLRLGLEPEVVQILYKNALSDEGIGSFMRTRQAEIYALMYYMTARFEEVKDLELRQIGKKGASIELLVYKGKRNQTRQLQRVVFHPNSMSHTGKHAQLPF